MNSKSYVILRYLYNCRELITTRKGTSLIFNCEFQSIWAYFFFWFLHSKYIWKNQRKPFVRHSRDSRQIIKTNVNGFRSGPFYIVYTCSRVRKRFWKLHRSWRLGNVMGFRRDSAQWTSVGSRRPSGNAPPPPFPLTDEGSFDNRWNENAPVWFTVRKAEPFNSRTPGREAVRADLTTGQRRYYTKSTDFRSFAFPSQ